MKEKLEESIMGIKDEKIDQTKVRKGGGLSYTTNVGKPIQKMFYRLSKIDNLKAFE